MLAALHTFLVYCANVGIVAEVHPYLSKIMSRFQSTAGLSYLEKFTREQLDATKSRLDNGSEKVAETDSTDFATKLLELHHQSPEKVSMKTVFTSCLSNIAAGSDTTSISLSAILYHLIRNPDKLSKVKDTSSRFGLL